MAESDNILTKLQDLLVYLIPQLNKFPRDQKFVLGDRIETKLLDVQEFCLRAYYSREKRGQRRDLTVFDDSGQPILEQRQACLPPIRTGLPRTASAAFEGGGGIYGTLPLGGWGQPALLGGRPIPPKSAHFSCCPFPGRLSYCYGIIMKTVDPILFQRMHPDKQEFKRLVDLTGWSKSEAARRLHKTPSAINHLLNPAHPNKPSFATFEGS